MSVNKSYNVANEVCNSKTLPQVRIKAQAIGKYGYKGRNKKNSRFKKITKYTWI